MIKPITDFSLKNLQQGRRFWMVSAIQGDSDCMLQKQVHHLFGFAEGQELSEHTSTQHALIQVLSGECEFSLAGQPHPLKSGDLLYMPPDLPHAVKATKQFSMLLTLFRPATAAASLVRLPGGIGVKP